MSIENAMTQITTEQNNQEQLLDQGAPHEGGDVDGSAVATTSIDAADVSAVEQNDVADNEDIVREVLAIDRNLLNIVTGPSGKHVDYIERNTSIKVQLPTQPDQPVVLQGKRNDIEIAKGLINGIINRVNRNTKTDYMIIPSSIAGKLIGHEGSQIRMISGRTNTQCHMQTDHSNRLLCLIAITGSENGIMEARRLFDERIDRLLSERSMDTIVMPQTAVSALIGKHGAIIQNINKVTGASCRIEETSTSATVYIIGDGRARQRARFLIEECIEDLIQRDSLVGPEESHMIFANPFPTHGVISINPFYGGSGYVMDVIQDHNMRLPPYTFNCISLYLTQNRMMFNLKSQRDLMNQLLGKVSDFVSKVANKEFSVVKLELSIGKQTFDSAGGQPPQRFTLPDSCRRANGRQLGQFFNNARFVDKAPQQLVEQVCNRLVEDGFQLQQRSAFHDQKSVDVYWKNLETKDRMITKLHVKTDGEIDLVHASMQKFKPIVITFMHPQLLADFRIRVVVRSDVTGDLIPEEIRTLIQNLSIKFVECGNENSTANTQQSGGNINSDANDGQLAAKAEIGYPVLFNVHHRCLRVKEKLRYFKDDFKASIHRIYQQSVPFYGPLPEYHQLLGLPSSDGDDQVRDVFSNEITFKSTRLNRLLRQYVMEFQALDAATDRLTLATGSMNASVAGQQDTQSVTGSGDDDDAGEQANLQQSRNSASPTVLESTDDSRRYSTERARAQHEQKLREDLAYELGVLISFGDSMVSNLPWKFD
ncbi:hypothetical protein MP228_008476 [Amoeboaphelidium protococcarum]|nr:hypothetical protein MP228_008476 [Amoeboaphelidium protococcarum]